MTLLSKEVDVIDNCDKDMETYKDQEHVQIITNQMKQHTPPRSPYIMPPPLDLMIALVRLAWGNTGTRGPLAIESMNVGNCLKEAMIYQGISSWSTLKMPKSR